MIVHARGQLALVAALLALTGCAKLKGKDALRAAQGSSSAQQPKEANPPQAALQSGTSSAETSGGAPRRPSGMNLREDWRHQPKEDGRPPVAKVDAQTLDGILRSVDADRRMLTVEVRGQQHTLPVDTLVHIETPADHARGLRGGLAGLQPGTRVMVMAYRYDDTFKVALIRIKAGHLAD